MENEKDPQPVPEENKEEELGRDCAGFKLYKFRLENGDIAYV